MYSRRFRGQGPELKFKDTCMYKDVAQDMQTAGGVMGTEESPDIGINFVAQGEAAYQRIGSRFSIVELQLKGVFERKPAEFTNNEQLEDCRCRLAIVLDKQCNGASTTYANVFNNDVGVVNYVDSSAVDWFQRVENNKRFTILYDEVKNLKAPQTEAYHETTDTTSTTGGSLVYFKKTLRFKTPIVIEMGGTTDIVDNVKSNNLIVCVATDQHDEFGPSCQVTTRILYTDR